MTDFNSDRQSEARRAYGDAELSKQVHGRMMETFNVDIRKNGAMRNRASVLGALAGLCTAASILAVARGAPHLVRAFLESDQVGKVLALALTGGLSLAFCVTVSFANERAVYELELKRELWEIDNHLSGELQEMIAIYRNQGLSEDEAHIVTRIFAKQRHLFAELMMVEELGYSRLQPPTVPEVITNASAPAVLGFFCGLVAPLVPLLVATKRLDGSAAGSLVPVAESVKRLSGCLVGLGAVVLSYLQSEVFFGAYTTKAIYLQTAAVNVAGIGSIYALSYALSKVV